MTSPEDIMAAMLATSRRLQTLIDEHASYVEREAEAIRSADKAEATAYLASTGTVAERQAHVARVCSDERYAAHVSKGLRESHKLAIQGAMSQLSALQSLASAMREEARLARVGEGP